jgi:hypothetical protein
MLEMESLVAPGTLAHLMSRSSHRAVPSTRRSGEDAPSAVTAVELTCAGWRRSIRLALPAVLAYRWAVCLLGMRSRCHSWDH